MKTFGLILNLCLFALLFWQFGKRLAMRDGLWKLILERPDS